MSGGVSGAGRGTAGRSVALDLGTARTRTVAPGGVAVLDRPSCVPSPDGSADQVWPIRHGMVASMTACHRLARAVLTEAVGQRVGRASGQVPEGTGGHGSGPTAGQATGPGGDRSAGGAAGAAAPGIGRILLGVPVAATGTERRAAQAAVGRAAGCPVVLVEEPLAAAIGCGVDVTDSRPRLLVDVGAGIVEAVVIGDAAVAEAGALQISARARDGLPPHAVAAVTDLVAGLVRRLPPHLRPVARAGGLLLTGGGAAQQDLAARLCAGLRVTVHPATRPAHATIRGLARLCLMPDLAGRVTAANPIDITRGSLT